MHYAPFIVFFPGHDHLPSNFLCFHFHIHCQHLLSHWSSSTEPHSLMHWHWLCIKLYLLIGWIKLQSELSSGTANGCQVGFYLWKRTFLFPFLCLHRSFFYSLQEALNGHTLVLFSHGFHLMPNSVSPTLWESPSHKSWLHCAKNELLEKSRCHWSTDWSCLAPDPAPYSGKPIKRKLAPTWPSSYLVKYMMIPILSRILCDFLSSINAFWSSDLDSRVNLGFYRWFPF